ncbi:MAG: AraC family ligand binding domain-containing protein, partial [Pseudomonadota bacterium]
MHKSARYPTSLPGVDAISIKSDRTFPRHSHDEFGFGYVVEGGQESWSGRGLVEAEAGDTLTVNPAEIHDGIGRNGQPRHWRMLFLSPAALAHLSGIPAASAEFSRPVNPSRRALRLTIDAIAAVTCDTPDRDQAEQLVMLALAAQLNSITSARALKPAQRSQDVQIVLEMIHGAWDAPLSLDDFATATQCSKFQVLRRFSRELGTTPYSYLTQH